MIGVPPERVVFEGTTDIVDYVSKGFPPSKKNFDRLLATVRVPLKDDEVQVATENDIVISQHIFTEIDNEQFAEVMQRVYENNVYNRNMAILGFFGGVALGLCIGVNIGGGSDKSKE